MPGGDGSPAKRFDEQEESVALPAAADAAGGGGGAAPFTFGVAEGAASTRFDAQSATVVLPAGVSPGAAGAAADGGEEDTDGVVLQKARVHRVLESGDWPVPGEPAPQTSPRRHGGGAAAAPAARRPLPPAGPGEEACWEFAVRIGADAASYRQLLSLPPPLRARVIERPLGGDVKDPSAVLLSRVRAAQSAPGPGGLGSDDVPDHLADRLEQWAEAKRARNFALADRLREELRAEGYDAEPTCRSRPARAPAPRPPPPPRPAPREWEPPRGRGPGKGGKGKGGEHILCKFWLQGRCTKGHACPFAHEGSGSCAKGDDAETTPSWGPQDPDDARSAPSVATDDADADDAARGPARPPHPFGGKGGYAPAAAPDGGGGWGGYAPQYGAAPPPPPQYPAPLPAAPPPHAPGGQMGYGYMDPHAQWGAPPPDSGGWWGPDGGWYPAPPPGAGGGFAPPPGPGGYGQQPPPPPLPDDPVTDDEAEHERESRLEQVRRRLADVVATLPAEKPTRRCLTVAFQLVLGEFTDAEAELLLGLEPNSVGLTRFRSVLLKRTLRHAHQAEAIDAVASLSRWEEALLPWLPPCPQRGYARHFEAGFCHRVLECCRVMAASPFARLRLPPSARKDAAREAAADPAAQCVVDWADWAAALAGRDAAQEVWPGLRGGAAGAASVDQGTDAGAAPAAAELPPVADDGGFSLSCGTRWAPDSHYRWPAPFRGRTRALLFAAARARGGAGVGLLRGSPRLLGGVLRFLTPVCASDVPKEERYPGSHDFLDLVVACVANYSLNALAPADAADDAEAKQRLGEQMWQYVVAALGDEPAPKLTGMLLQMDAPEVLLHLVNARRFTDALHDAWKVLLDAGGGGEGEG